MVSLIREPSISGCVVHLPLPTGLFPLRCIASFVERSMAIGDAICEDRAYDKLELNTSSGVMAVPTQHVQIQTDTFGYRK